MFHWNIEGRDLPAYHDFFGDVYDDLWAQTDTLAEFIRQLDEKAPGSLSVYLQTSLIKDEEGFPDTMEMFQKLQADTQTMISLYEQ